MITFFIPGEPAAQARPRCKCLRIGPRLIPQIYDLHNADEWKARIQLIARPYAPKAPMLGPVRLAVTFYVTRPQGHYRGKAHALRPEAPNWHISKPDGDNFVKALLDALTVVRIWVDDAQVCDQRIQKVYAQEGKSGALVTIAPIEDDPIYELGLNIDQTA
jgi:Holliday junction resolvase RusA-like endonuclease